MTHSIDTKKQDLKLLSWFVPIFIILAQYPIIETSTISYGLVCISIYTLFLSLHKNLYIYIQKYLLYLSCLLFIIFLIKIIRSDIFSWLQFNSQIMMFWQLYIISLVAPLVTLSRLYQSYKLIGLICIVMILYQSIMLNIYQVPVSPFTILPLTTSELHL